MKSSRADIEIYREMMEYFQNESATKSAYIEAQKEELTALREYCRSASEREAALLAEIKEMQEEHQSQLKELRESFEKRLDRMAEANASLSQQLGEALKNTNHNRAKRFGRSSEQARLLNNRGLDNRQKEKDDFDGNPPAGGTTVNDQSEKPAPQTDEKKSPKSGGRNNLKEGPTHYDEIVHHKLDEYFNLPEGARFMMRNGKPDINTVYYVEEIKARLVCHMYQVVRYKNADNETFESSLPEEVKKMTPVKGCPFTPDLLAEIILQRFVYYQPQKRVGMILRDMGAHIPKSTLNRYFSMTEQALIDMLGDVLHREICQGKYFMVDETCELVCVEDKTTGAKRYLRRYLWAFLNREKNLVEYIYENGSRSQEVLKEFFKLTSNLEMFLSSDGYAAYRIFDSEEYPNVTHIGCWTHCRRNFVDSLPTSRKESLAMLEEIGALFTTESLAMDLPEKERLKWRKKMSAPALERIRKMALRMQLDDALMSDPLLKKAVNYTLNQWDSLANILKSGLVEISNNLCEQKMKPIKLALKNCQNIGSEAAAKRHGFVHSIIESAKMNGLKIRDYLVNLFSSMKTALSDESRLMLLPHMVAKC